MFKVSKKNPLPAGKVLAGALAGPILIAVFWQSGSVGCESFFFLITLGCWLIIGVKATTVIRTVGSLIGQLFPRRNTTTVTARPRPQVLEKHDDTNSIFL